MGKVYIDRIANKKGEGELIYKGPNVIETPFTSIFIDKSSEIKLNKNNLLEIKIKSNDKAKLNEGATSFW